MNSDGRTSGISLPAEAFQTKLLRAVYDRAGVDPDEVVYVEAHGAGTQAGDPIEAAALEAVLGHAREKPLPIGSIKTNIGHLEPASGLAGALKAMLALERGAAPSSLHFDSPNPNIDFGRLNLAVTVEATPLPRTRDRRFVGVSSFGFGGTNAHVILADPPKAKARPQSTPRYLMLSAQSEGSLRALAADYAARLSSGSKDEARGVIAATAYRRERMRERLLLPAEDAAALQSSLRSFADSETIDPTAARGAAIDGDKSVVFVFSGNGAQWEGMGRAAFRRNADFRIALRDVDAHFAPLAGWSLEAKLASPSLEGDLARTSVAQPLIFAIHAASVRALAAVGVRPSLTMGHSVGEVAAAEAAGALSLTDAVKVIVHRSRHQESTANTAGMVAIIGPREAAVSLVEKFPALAVAGHNSYRCIVAAGPMEALRALADCARETQELRVQRLDLAYPFHTSLMRAVKAPLLRSLADLAPLSGAAPFLSTIADAVVPGPSLDARYWWRNVREPVLFHEGVERALDMGKRVFLEIGSRPMLRGHLRDSINQKDVFAVADVVLDDKFDDLNVDPFEHCAIRLLAAGATFGPDPGAGVELPAYPWRRTPRLSPVVYRLNLADTNSLFLEQSFHIASTFEIMSRPRLSASPHADAYFATGNTLSIISNRISYIFDLHGPSLTIDTACSSSLVALHEACETLARGEIDSAIVGGVNILASPFGFVSFSQATMLSPTGLCRAFSGNADGYVRSEGGVVFLLKTLDRAVAETASQQWTVWTDRPEDRFRLVAEDENASAIEAAVDQASCFGESLGESDPIGVEPDFRICPGRAIGDEGLGIPHQSQHAVWM